MKPGIIPDFRDAQCKVGNLNLEACMNHAGVIGESSGSHRGVIRESSGSHWEVIRESSMNPVPPGVSIQILEMSGRILLLFFVSFLPSFIFLFIIGITEEPFRSSMSEMLKTNIMS